MREVEGSPKMLSVSHLFEVVRPYVVFIQETMVLVEKAREFFQKILLGWEMCTINSLGQS